MKFCWLVVLVSAVGVVVVFGVGVEDSCDYDNLTHTLHSLAASHPSLTRLFSIATTKNGRELWVMILSDSVDLRPILRPQVKLVGNINGYSGPACQLLLYFVEEFLEGYHVTDSVERRLLQTLEIHVLFNMNPDAYAETTPGHCSPTSSEKGLRRLNEDFRLVFPPMNAREEEMAMEDNHRRPETLGVTQWTHDNNFIISLSLVSGFKGIVVPFDDRFSHPGEEEEEVENPDTDIFHRMATSYLSAISWQDSPRWHCPSINRTFPRGFTTGANWYSIKGSMMDFSYVYGGTFEMMIGLTCCRNENDPKELRKLWLLHRRGLVQALREADRGMKGQVVDGVTGEVLGGVRFNRVDARQPLPMIWHTSPQGEFWRPLPPGHHLIHASKEGYRDERVEIEVGLYSATLLQISLQPKEIPSTLTTEIDPDDVKVAMPGSHNMTNSQSTAEMSVTMTPESPLTTTAQFEVTTTPMSMHEVSSTTNPKIMKKIEGKNLDRFQTGFSAIWGHLRSTSASSTLTFSFIIPPLLAAIYANMLL